MYIACAMRGFIYILPRPPPPLKMVAWVRPF
jgi:hypothetical protein